VCLLVSGERLGDDRDPRQPLDLRHPVPAGDDQAEREAVLGEERAAVHPVGEEDVVAQRLPDRQAALVLLALPAFDAPVEPGEDDLDGVGGRTGLGEDRR
jgi:hypothetical protein